MTITGHSVPNMQKKVLFFIGTRPEVIKLAPLIDEFKLPSRSFEPMVCFTGQHREMSIEATKSFDLFPDLNLDLNSENYNSMSELLAAIIEGADSTIKEYRPDLVIVQGDTATTLGAAIASFFNNVQVAHVEAGLRSYDYYAPYPEEANRVIVSRLANIHFCPTQHNANCLRKENVSADIHVTGNTIVDALHHIMNRIQTQFAFKDRVLEELEIAGYPMYDHTDAGPLNPSTPPPMKEKDIYWLQFIDEKF